MSHTLLTHTMIAERSLFDLQNELVMSRHVYKGYNSEFKAVGSFKKGSSVTIALPNKFRAKDGATMDVVDQNERSTSVTVDTQKHVAWEFTETELTLSVEEFSRKYVRPATIALANKVDYDGCGEYVNIYNLMGTPGTTPATFQVLADAGQRLDNEAIIREGRVGVLSPKAHWAMVAGELKGLFSTSMVESLVRKSYLGQVALIDFYMDQNIRSHTTGTFTAGSTPVMNGATAEGATSLVTSGWAASTLVLKAGDIITVAGVYGVNPVSGGVWEGSELRQFVVGANVTSGAGGAATITISPAIYSASATEKFLPYQTVDAVPVNGAAITPVGTQATAYPQNLIYHPNCFALTMVPFDKPKSAGQSVMWGQASDPQMGLSITVSTAFDITNYKEMTRMDVLYGWDTIEPNYGLRITG